MLSYRTSWIAHAIGRMFSMFGRDTAAAPEVFSDLTENAQMQPVQTSIEAIARSAQACGDGCGGGDLDGSCVGCNANSGSSVSPEIDIDAPTETVDSRSDALIDPVPVFSDAPKSMTLTVSIKAAASQTPEGSPSKASAPANTKTSDLALRLEIVSKMNTPVARKRKRNARVAPAGKAIPVRAPKQQRVVRSAQTPVWPAYKGRIAKMSPDLRTRSSGQIIALPADNLDDKVARILERAA